jgi:hypothetical protein
MAEVDCDIYTRIIIFRSIALFLLQNTTEKDFPIILPTIWKLLYKSIIAFSDKDIIATIGSQGFLSVPLYHSDKGEKSFDFFRLHIWDTSLEQFIDFKKTEQFAIHSHQFYAHSWIIAGEILNTQHIVQETSENTEYSYFEIKWNNSANEVNSKTSLAVNTNIFANVKALEVERYGPGAVYQINAGEFHKSRVNTDKPINATIFLFTTKKGRVPKSFVLGPSDITESKINRKIMIEARPLIEKLNTKIIEYERQTN